MFSTIKNDGSVAWEQIIRGQGRKGSFKYENPSKY